MVPPRRFHRPSPAVAHVARTHGLVGVTALLSLLVLHFATRSLDQVEFGPRTYALALGIGVAYCLAGLLVWFGAPGGRSLSRVCGFVYFVRPGLGVLLWQIMDSPEYQAHFADRR